MARELIALRDSHVSKKYPVIPQLFYNHVFMNLNGLEEKTESVFLRLQYRICHLPSMKQNPPRFCQEDFNYHTELLVLSSPPPLL